jgi:4-amino-4-deoxy-L-arabinose transferase-like glycosyltransferase
MVESQLEIQNSKLKTMVWFVVCGVLILSAVSASWMLSATTLENHECFVSITSREMLKSGDWILPTCNAELRLQKTPLSYWLVAGLAEITGKVDEFTTRLPSAISAFLSAVAILYFVNRWLSLRIAAISTAVWVTSLCYIRYSHNARPEMLLTFFITLCLLSFYSAVTESSRSRQVAYMLMFWVSFALANLAKGPAPLPLVLSPLFFYIAIFREWKKIPKLLPVVGLIIFLLIILPWPLAIGHRVNWDLAVWKSHFVDRFFGKFDSGHKPLYYYLGIMFVFITPWVAFLPMALAAPFYKTWNKKQPVMKFLWLWFVVDLGVITICGGKRQHYILPSMPAMAILIGILLEDMVFVQKAFTAKFAKGVLLWHVVVFIAIAAALPIYVAWTKPQLLAHQMYGGLAAATVVAAVTIILIIVVAALFARKHSALGCVTIFAGIVLIVMIGSVIFVNQLNYNEPSRQFSLTVAKIVPVQDKLVAYSGISTRFVHYFGRPVAEIQSRDQVSQLYEQNFWIVAFGKDLDELLGDSHFELVYRQEPAEWHGQDAVAGGLFHKSAAPVLLDESRKGSGNEDNSGLKDKPILPGQ